MKAVDTSITVPMFAAWHEHHDRVQDLYAEPLALPAHIALETYSVLTRLPEPFRASRDRVRDWLRLQFDVPLAPPDGPAHQALLDRLVEHGIGGGAVYDALVAATCLLHDLTLVTADVRAAPTYRDLGVATDPRF